MPQPISVDRPHSDLTRSILESAMRVQSVLGVGLYEKPYKACLAHALRQKGHHVLMEVKLDSLCLLSQAWTAGVLWVA